MGGFPGAIKKVLLSPVLFMPRHLAFLPSQMCCSHRTLFCRGKAAYPHSLAQQQVYGAHTHRLGVWEAVRTACGLRNGIRGVSAQGVGVAGVGGAEGNEGNRSGSTVLKLTR